MRRNLRVVVMAAVTTIVVGSISPAIASTTFPGKNGDVVFSGSGGIYRIDPRGVDRRRLTDDGVDPAASPNGEQIAFTRCCRPGFKRDLFVMNADGSDIRPVVTSKDSLYPSWAPDGETIVFVRTWWKGVDVFSIRTDGSDLTRLTETPGKPEGDPSVSPAGDQLLFSRFEEVQDVDEEIFLMDLDRGRTRRLTVNETRDYFPSWSPDGTMIAYVSVIESKGSAFPREEIILAAADGSGATQLTFTPDRQEFSPVFSPNGERLAFSVCCLAPSFLGDLASIRVDGSGERRITQTDRAEGDPNWMVRHP